MKKRNVDIVIPVYNAFDFTKKCIETVIEHTDLKENRLVIINDKSSDKKILPMLQKFVEEYKELNIKLIDNDENLGFVKTVNKGMSDSKENDVILLNSDTEVTKNWLNKLREVAYIRENVATVTPLSNNATLASVPNFLEENELPSFMTLEEYSEEIEKCSFNLYPELTTAHGFCMYIRRDAIDLVGLFDDITFEKGYGEENDFSYRCMKSGLTNLLCDNTFIYHKGTQSFNSEKEEFINSHIKLLQEKHPENFDKNTFLCMNHPYKFVQENIKYDVNNHRKNVLIIAHEFFKLKHKMVGGTVYHIYDLINNLKEKMNFHVVFLENGTYRIRSFFEDSTSEIILGKVSNYDSVEFYNHEYKNLMEKVFKIINVDFVHIHHLMHHYFDIVDLIKEKNIPYVITLHDFYMICPTFALLENNKKYCGDNPNCDCTKCLKETRNIETNIIPKWRELSYSVLKDAKEVFVPSNSTKEIVNQYFEDINITVIEHGVDSSKYEEILNVTEELSEGRKLNIAFIGGINKIKGLDFLKLFVNECNKENSKYNIHVFGQPCEDGLNQSVGNYICHGRYNREDVPRLMKENKIDVVLILAIWPETYSYILTETILANVPVIAFDLGAQGDRIKENNLGWILDRKSTFDEILEKIDAVLLNRREYKEKLDSIHKYVKSLKTIKEMIKEYDNIYSKYLSNKNFKKESLSNGEFHTMLMATQEIQKLEDTIDNQKSEIKEYHKTVLLLREEIDRLNKENEKYYHLFESRRIKLLRKIKYIKF